ncbi:MAG TPA: DUF6151 family protein [Casimicrobiaceae bacterium]|jgi:hypothetical protein|nr:DUF6151 family protein [Casimicrobiaceae bacterium]
MNHALRCRCGTLRGELERSGSATRAICYCQDCQAYARFLGTPGVVDADGGTEVVALLPRHVRFTAGSEALACLSLSERGLLRWYASCCNTPVGNTPRNPKVPYVGLIHACLEGGSPAIETTFGAPRIAVNTQSAHRAVRSTPIATAARVVGLMTAALADRLGGLHRHNPFFTDTGAPIRAVRVLSSAERERAYGREH